MSAYETPAGTLTGPDAVIWDAETGESIELERAPDDYEGETLTVTWDKDGVFRLA
jgi:hypothetical protein